MEVDIVRFQQCSKTNKSNRRNLWMDYLYPRASATVFCSTSLPLASTRWVLSTINFLHCPHSKQCTTVNKSEQHQEIPKKNMETLILSPVWQISTVSWKILDDWISSSTKKWNHSADSTKISKVPSQNTSSLFCKVRTHFFLYRNSF